MITINQPFEFEKGKELIVLVKGGSHPYRKKNNLIQHKRIFSKWQKDEPFLAEDWIEEVIFILGAKIKRYKCVGRDMFFGYNDQFQVVNNYKKNLREVRITDELAKWIKKARETGELDKIPEDFPE